MTDERPAAGGIRAGGTVPLALDSLVPAPHYPRLGGVNEDHVLVLAESPTPLPPILVQRSMQVIDGMHRVCAARLRGDSYIMAVVLDEDDTEAYVRSFTANIAHGLPLTLRDRKAGAERLLRICPDKSDRAIAALVGLSGKTVGMLRGRLGDLPQPTARVGRDGRVRAVDGTEHRRLAARLMAERPGAPLREIAALTGLSTSTVSVIRRHLKSGGTIETLAARPPRAGQGGANDVDPDPGRTLSHLMRDPSLRYTDAGRTLLRWLHGHPIIDEPAWQDTVAAIPPHCLPAVVRLARRFAGDWNDLARQIEELMLSDAG
ncbi:ParB/RepB/Spo0J family partition protein [Nonomuraea sp. NN258]|uniref:ParB/RepB/Spo0J family partition protein n=1 Tax=Nonomuraea antri TaxID=2730852 RepID=UPI001568EC9C|nr:ParB/RepB/Spo0J family partition protein [Nonomuraea antri]NRQ33098.1 ParB/RepB/Spo0J family partition protein [Nonomuraea antri]